MPRGKDGKKGRKIGRDENKCRRYRAEGRRERNLARKLRRHVRVFPDDVQAFEAARDQGLAV